MCDKQGRRTDKIVIVAVHVSVILTLDVFDQEGQMINKMDAGDDEMKVMHVIMDDFCQL